MLVGMSGGVDSSVTALLLKLQGYQVEGVFMHNWNPHFEHPSSLSPSSKPNPRNPTRCTAEKDYRDAQDVASALGIKLRRVSFERQYWSEVFEPSLLEFERGHTPNPDILCNRFVKFSHLTHYAFNVAGADWLATGHYARMLDRPSAHGPYRALHRGLDEKKDQSYFLGAVRGEELQRVLFPLGELPKTEVRRLAREHGLVTASKPDSMGICFVNNKPGAFTEFLSGYVDQQPGRYVVLDHNLSPDKAPSAHELRTIEGERHMGVKFYTVGERARIGGLAESWYICGKDLERNLLFIGPGRDNSALFSRRLTASAPVWFHPCDLAEISQVDSAKIRSIGPPAPIQRISHDPVNDTISVDFEQPQRAITPGQYIVLYSSDRVCGAARIESAN